MNVDAHDIAAPPLPLLVTGIMGVAGFNALRHFRSLYGGDRCPDRVIGIRPRHSLGLQGEDIVGCDMEDGAQMRRLFDRYKFRSVLDCAGNCALKPCETDPDLAYRFNVSKVRGLLDAAVPAGARIVHLSIDLVFAGRPGGNYRETEPPDPVTVYGKTMAEGEREVLRRDSAACVLRISLPMGPSFSGHAGAIDWIESRFSRGLPATLYYDEVRTPAYCECLNEVCRRLLASDAAGIYHAPGPRRVSLYQIAQIINRVGDYDPSTLFGLHRGQAGPIPPRAGNVTMNGDKLRDALGFEPFSPWPLDDRLMPTHRQWHALRSDGVPSGPEEIVKLLATRPTLSGR